MSECLCRPECPERADDGSICCWEHEPGAVLVERARGAVSAFVNVPRRQIAVVAPALVVALEALAEATPTPPPPEER
jgi:hypothetical protein